MRAGSDKEKGRRKNSAAQLSVRQLLLLRGEQTRMHANIGARCLSRRRRK